MITDDMYFEWTKEDTEADCLNILKESIPGFQFPRFPLYDFTIGAVVEDEETGEVSFVDTYNCHLTSEEINILAYLMYNVWLQRQIASIENTRMKYSGTDFKMTSQANHLRQLIELKKEAERQCHHIQRLYKRRKLIDNKGSIKSNWTSVMQRSTFDDF